MWAAPAGGEGGEGGEGGTEGGGACWVGPHRSTNRRGGAEGPSPESSSGGPSAQDALLGVLAQAVARAARLRTYAAAQASRRHAPRGVLGFVEALQAEVQRLTESLWQFDTHAQHAQAARAGGAAGAARAAAPSLLGLLGQLRGAQGWLHALAALDGVVAALRRGEREGERQAAAAAAAEGAAESAAEGAAAREVSWLIAQLLERVRAEQRQRSVQGPLLRMWVRLLLATLSPYVRLLQHWVCEGSLVDPAGEMPLRSATFAQAGEEGW
eukprot:scaffold75757_cov48-Phaeocystis_antarctica.AAC.1